MRNARRRSGKTQAGRPDTEAGAARHRTESWPAARRLGGSAARRLGGSAARRLGGSAARRLGGSAARRLGGSAARRLGGSAARRLGGSAARRLGGSAAIIAWTLSAIVNPLGGISRGERPGPLPEPGAAPSPFLPGSPLTAVSARRRRPRLMWRTPHRKIACLPNAVFYSNSFPAARAKRRAPPAHDAPDGRIGAPGCGRSSRPTALLFMRRLAARGGRWRRAGKAAAQFARRVLFCYLSPWDDSAERARRWRSGRFAQTPRRL